MAFLFTQKPVVIDVDLAVMLGTNEAIVLQQMNYWIEANKKAGRNFVDGQYWTYCTIKQWHEQLPFLAEKTIKRTIDNLRDKGILLTSNFNQKKFDRTLWYTINFTVLEELLSENKAKIDFPKKENALGQNDQMEEDKLTSATGQTDPMHEDNLTQPIPEINKEITTETNINKNIHIASPEKGKALPKKDKEQIRKIFTDYAQGDEELLQSLMDFAEMRKAINDQLSTERAAKTLLTRLDKLAGNTTDKIEILNLSILNNWKGVFALKKENALPSGVPPKRQDAKVSKFTNTASHEWDFAEIQRLEREYVQRKLKGE